VEELTARLARDRQHQNILMIDLDRFKAVNDTLGHSAGDDLVRKICTGIQGVLPPDAVLGRLGGDEFGVIVEAAAEARMASICTHILKVCAQTRYIMGHEVQVSASIGVAQQGSTHSEMELMRQADLALYAAKREGKNRCRVFDTALDKATRYRLSIENGLERALRSGQLKMVYQPIVKADDGAILGFEALIRWDSPDHGAISPAEFIPIAEETGLILDIGDWITRQALRDCRRWRGPYVSINLSTRQFLRHNVGERILRYAAEADVRPEQVQIELTETAIIDDVERAAYNLKIMRAAGVRVALDDFGTGYSSLTYLKQFAIDCIKIDKSFVDNITRDRQSAVIVASVSKLANSLGMSVVAEGVETEDQRRILIATGVKALQGFYFSKPVTAREAAVMLGRRARGQEGADAEADAERAEYARRGLG
jgi:diguanylate cyclase (GGDEF)-like protein